MFMPPMLLEKREAPFDDERFIFEPKIDGHRMIISIQSGEVRLFTRHNNDVTRKYPELHNVPIDDQTDAVLDGEVACIAPDTGSIDFELIQARFQLNKPSAIEQAVLRQPVVFFAFDILRYKGRDLRGLTLPERKAILRQVMSDNEHFSQVISVDGSGESLFKVIQAKKLEGMVAKNKASKYASRRDRNWLKIINYSHADCQIAGYRKREFGWLLQHENRPVGILELAVPPTHKKAFYGVAKGLVTGEDKNFVYVKPSITAKVRFRNWYHSGALRSPEFVRFVV